jgi:antibiotic biosynthesis monooxygenase (ABM) superfamily enzyme
MLRIVHNARSGWNTFFEMTSEGGEGGKPLRPPPKWKMALLIVRLCCFGHNGSQAQAHTSLLPIFFRPLRCGLSTRSWPSAARMTSGSR